MNLKHRSTNTYTTEDINTSINFSATLYKFSETRTYITSLKKTYKLASPSKNNNNHQERPHHNEVNDLTNIPTSPEVDDNLTQGNDIPYTVRREHTTRRELLRARCRSSLYFPTQESTLVSYGSTEVDSNEIRPIEADDQNHPAEQEHLYCIFLVLAHHVTPQ